MKRLEIIHLRSSPEPIESLAERIRKSIRSGGDPAEIVTLYRRDGLETDLAVHIHLSGIPGKGGPSDLGLRLATMIALVIIPCLYLALVDVRCLVGLKSEEVAAQPLPVTP